MKNEETALILKYVCWAVANQVENYLSLIYFDVPSSELVDFQFVYLNEKIDLACRSFTSWYCNLDQDNQAKAVTVARELYT